MTSALTAAIVLGAGLVQPAAAAAPTTVSTTQVSDAGRVMVVGDSISHGSSGDWTWRYRLWKHLETNGVSVDFVGPRNDLHNIMTVADGDGDNTYADPGFDQDHNAQWGRAVAFEMNDIAAKVTQHDPGTLLVLLGINDLGWFGHDPARVEADMRTLIANARTAKPDLRIVVGKVLPTRRAAEEPAFAAKVADVNSRLVATATELTTSNSPIVVADTTTGFDAAAHTWDGTHPNARGELRIAAAFADELSASFGIGTAYPRPFPEVPLGPQQAPQATVTRTGTSTADLAWTPSLGANQYWIWVKDDYLNPEWSRLPIPLSQDYNPWHMEGLGAGTYHYKVQAAKGDNAGAFSNEVTLTIAGTTPDAPTGFTVTAGNGEAVLRWTAAEHATGYLVHVRNVTAGETDFQQLPIPVPAPEWTAGMLDNGATYEFKLQSVNGRLSGGTTAAVSVTPTGPTPQAPTNFRATNGNGEATLEWTSDPNATGHQIHVRNVTAGETIFTELPYPVGGEQWVAGMLVNGGTYEFKLRAVNGRILGGFSPVVTVRPTVAPPAAPTGLTATPGNGKATFRWTEATNATGYYVHVRNVTAGETGFTRLPYPVEGPSWTAEVLTNGGTYEFKFQSVSGLIEGAVSAVVRVTPTVAPPAGPTNLTATAESHAATLRWTEATNATGYYVHVRNVTAGETGFTRLPYQIWGDEWTAEVLTNGATYEFKLQSVSGLIEGGLSAIVRVTPTGPAPAAPTGMSARAGDRKAVLTWDMPDHANAVYLYVRNVTAGESNFTRLPYPIYDDRWTATQLINGATYQYKVQAYNDLIPGGTSSAVTVTPSAPPPPGPEDLTVVAGNQKATLKWSGSSRATGYDIWIREVTFGIGWKKMPYTIADDNFTAGLLVNGATYEFKVQSWDGMNAGGYSNTVSVVPRGPTPQVSNLRVTPKLGEARLAWTGSSTATGYYIQQRDVTAGAGFKELTYPVTGNTFTAGLLIPGHVYEFRVQAVSGRQRGVTSNTVRVTLPKPGAVSGLKVTPGLFSLKASWDAVPGVDGYMIYHGWSGLCNDLDGVPTKAEMTRLPVPVTRTSFTLEYALKPGCHWINAVPVKYGVEATFDMWASKGAVPLKSNDDSHMYEQIVTYIHGEMYRNARSTTTKMIRAGMQAGGPAAGAALVTWANQVKPGGVWDHKPPLRINPGKGYDTADGLAYRHRATGTAYEVYYDIWSNIHYGYVGREAGISAKVLQTGAGLVGITDAGDVRAIQLGINLWSSHGLSLSRAQVDAIVRANLAAFRGEGKAIDYQQRLVPNSWVPGWV